MNGVLTPVRDLKLELPLADEATALRIFFLGCVLDYVLCLLLQSMCSLRFTPSLSY